MILTADIKVGETRYSENDGWNGKTLVPLPDAPPNMVLQIWTCRQHPDYGGALVTNALCMEKQGDYLYYSLRGCFSRRVLETHPERVTEQLVRAQHERACTLLDELVRYATAHCHFQAAQARAV